MDEWLHEAPPRPGEREECQQESDVADLDRACPSKDQQQKTPTGEKHERLKKHQSEEAIAPSTAHPKGSVSDDRLQPPCGLSRFDLIVDDLGVRGIGLDGRGVVRNLLDRRQGLEVQPIQGRVPAAAAGLEREHGNDGQLGLAAGVFQLGLPRIPPAAELGTRQPPRRGDLWDSAAVLLKIELAQAVCIEGRVRVPRLQVPRRFFGQ